MLERRESDKAALRRNLQEHSTIGTQGYPQRVDKGDRAEETKELSLQERHIAGLVA